MNMPDFADTMRERLFAQRVVPIFGPLTDESVSEVAAQLWTLDAASDDPVTLMASCRGGSVRATLALIDALDVVEVAVNATCLGALEGPPVAILAACARRRAAPSTRFFLRDEADRIDGPFRTLEQSARALFDERRQLLERLAASTKGRHSLGDLVADFERGRGLSVDEAITYGLIDEVTPDGDRIVALGRLNPGIGFRKPSR
ncbi:MAG: ATP-dependent Clp protease proteolytic subunit [Acidimicrobiales bacterium]